MFSDLEALMEYWLALLVCHAKSLADGPFHQDRYNRASCRTGDKIGLWQKVRYLLNFETQYIFFNQSAKSAVKPRDDIDLPMITTSLVCIFKDGWILMDRRLFSPVAEGRKALRVPVE